MPDRADFAPLVAIAPKWKQAERKGSIELHHMTHALHQKYAFWKQAPTYTQPGTGDTADKAAIIALRTDGDTEGRPHAKPACKCANAPRSGRTSSTQNWESNTTCSACFGVVSHAVLSLGITRGTSAFCLKAARGSIIGLLIKLK